MFSGTPEQCFLLGYRTLAREIYTKSADAALTDERRGADKGMTLVEQVMIQTSNQGYEIGVTKGRQDQDHYKSVHDRILESQDFNTVRGYVIEFEAPPPVMCSGGIFPEQDFEGVELQDFTDLSNTLDQISFTSFCGGERGVVAFSWLAESDRTCCTFVESLKAIPDELVAAALLRLFFTHCENVHMEPAWWEGLPKGTRTALVRRMELLADDEIDRPKAYLAHDGLVFSPWAIVRRYHIQSDR